MAPWHWKSLSGYDGYDLLEDSVCWAREVPKLSVSLQTNGGTCWVVVFFLISYYKSWASGIPFVSGMLQMEAGSGQHFGADQSVVLVMHYLYSSKETPTFPEEKQLWISCTEVPRLPYWFWQLSQALGVVEANSSLFYWHRREISIFMQIGSFFLLIKRYCIHRSR